MSESRKTNEHPWFIGPFAMYARSFEDAKKVYEHIKDEDAFVEPFGTVSLTSGEEIDWINIGYIRSGIACPSRLY